MTTRIRLKSHATGSVDMPRLGQAHFIGLLRKCPKINGAGEGNRTLVSGLGSPHSTIEPHPRCRALGLCHTFPQAARAKFCSSTRFGQRGSETPNSKKAPSPKHQRGRWAIEGVWSLRFGICLEFGPGIWSWDLELGFGAGIWSLRLRFV